MVAYRMRSVDQMNRLSFRHLQDLNHLEYNFRTDGICGCGCCISARRNRAALKSHEGGSVAPVVHLVVISGERRPVAFHRDQDGVIPNRMSEIR